MKLLDICKNHNAIEPITPVDAPEPPPEMELSGADCEHCPACGTWDYQNFTGKRLCFYRAYFLGKSGKPVDINIQRRDCPLNKRQ